MPPMNADIPSSEGGILSGDELHVRRQRLAQMIGHLLARTWVQRRRNPHVTSAIEGEPTATQPPTDTPPANCERQRTAT